MQGLSVRLSLGKYQQTLSRCNVRVEMSEQDREMKIVAPRNVRKANAGASLSPPPLSCRSCMFRAVHRVLTRPVPTRYVPRPLAKPLFRPHSVLPLKMSGELSHPLIVG